MATNFVAKLWKNLLLHSLHLSLCRSKTESDIATSMSVLTAQVLPLYCAKIS